jgi:hypothetical protein
MSPLIKLTKYLQPMQRGECKSQLFLGDDGYKYVVKLKGNPKGVRILVNELISYRLGKELGLPMASGYIVKLPANTIKKVPKINNLSFDPGIHFATLYYKNTARPSRNKRIENCINLDKVPLMIVFDHWISNKDRAPNLFNLLIKLTSSYKLRLIDHGGCFYRNWTEKLLKQNINKVEVYWGRLYDLFVPFIDNNNPFYEAIQTIENIDRSTLERIILDIPNEWSVTDEELNTLVDYLDHRKTLVKYSIEQLKPYFPLWSQIK